MLLPFCSGTSVSSGFLPALENHGAGPGPRTRCKLQGRISTAQDLGVADHDIGGAGGFPPARMSEVGLGRLDRPLGSPGPPWVSSSPKHLPPGPGRREEAKAAVPASPPLGEGRGEGDREKSTAFIGNFFLLHPSGNSETNPPVHSRKNQFRQIAASQ